MNRFLLAAHTQDRAPSGCGPQGPAAECELISARTLRLALTAPLLVGFTSQAYAQGCSMCLTSAMSQGVRAIEAMNLGILILLVPPFLMILAIFTFLFLRRS
jgi:hypothetical protein